MLLNIIAAVCLSRKRLCENWMYLHCFSMKKRTILGQMVQGGGRWGALAALLRGRLQPCNVPPSAALFVQLVIGVRTDVVNVVVYRVLHRIGILAYGQRQVIGTVIKSVFTDGGHAVGDDSAGQAAAGIECKIADRSHAVGKGDIGQAEAGAESRIADGSHAVGKGDAGQAAAGIERGIARCV